MNKYLMTALLPPMSACRFTCGTSCAAPVTVLWLFSVVSIGFGFLGGPSNEPDISWSTIAMGMGTWAISAGWTVWAMNSDNATHCQAPWQPREASPASDRSEPDTLEQAKKVH